MSEYWRRNIIGATTARKLALRTGACDPEEAFLAGMMQNIAMLAMDIALGESYGALANAHQHDHSTLPAVEKKTLGFDHAYVGSQLAAKWRFAPEQVDAIANHHRDELAHTSTNPLTRVLIVSNAISRAMIIEDCADARHDANSTAEEVFGLDSEIVAAVIEETEEDAKDLARQLMRGLQSAPASDEILRRAEEARMAHQIAIERETEQLRRTARDLERRTNTDALTKVGNRALLDRELDQHFHRVRQNPGSLGFILLDADRFKDLNDTHGHQAGDTVLIELARRLTDVIGEAGIVCRYGGEEFAVLLPEASEQSTAETAERLRQAIADVPFALDESIHGQATVDVSVSAGVAIMNAETATVYRRPELITQAADKSLYAAKDAGRNCVRVFRPRPRPRSAAA
jgi:diguanylate cyclase (GGDEF)-like protein